MSAKQLGEELLLGQGDRTTRALALYNRVWAIQAHAQLYNGLSVCVLGECEDIDDHCQLMNTVIDAMLEYCGHPYYHGQIITAYMTAESISPLVGIWLEDFWWAFRCHVQDVQNQEKLCQ